MKFKTANGPITVNVATSAELVSLIVKKINKKQSFAIATLNLDHLAKMNSDAGFYHAYKEQDYVISDGNPIVWMARLARRRLELLPGSELIDPLCQQLAEMGESVAFIGSTQAALDKAEAHLTNKYPNLRVITKISPPFGFDPEGPEADELLATIRDLDVRMAFLAFGAPKQEILAHRGKEIAHQTGFVSIGAGLDFLAGTQNRAPLWVQRLAMEWLWRLALNPRRLAWRYAKCFAVLPGHCVRSYAARSDVPLPESGQWKRQER